MKVSQIRKLLINDKIRFAHIDEEDLILWHVDIPTIDKDLGTTIKVEDIKGGIEIITEEKILEFLQVKFKKLLGIPLITTYGHNFSFVGANAAIRLRILHHYFASQTYLYDFIDQLIAKFGDEPLKQKLTVSMAIKIIAKSIRGDDVSCPLLIYIVLDEFQNLVGAPFCKGDNKQEERQYLKEVTLALCGAMCCKFSINHVFIICHLAGTVLTPLSNVVTSSSYQHITLPTPLLLPIDINSLFEQLQLTKSWWLNSLLLRATAYDIMLPRGIEAFLEYISNSISKGLSPSDIDYIKAANCAHDRIYLPSIPSLLAKKILLPLYCNFLLDACLEELYYYHLTKSCQPATIMLSEFYRSARIRGGIRYLQFHLADSVHVKILLARFSNETVTFDVKNNQAQNLNLYNGNMLIKNAEGAPFDSFYIRPIYNHSSWIIRCRQYKRFLNEGHPWLLWICTIAETNKDVEMIPDNVILTNKSSFHKLFGIFATRLQFIMTNKININTVINVNLLKYIVGVGSKYAEKIIKNRPYKNENDMKEKLQLLGIPNEIILNVLESVEY
ncbi:hypothetical protein F8M41_001695 [Gigaspora margarita]|uniref:Uncharacterized protein n=1 Tax=Gigaspora margarita TaxID=4874 RepID=A0A8H3XH11_GIGMA|nr:hypothetical protein F8M41_001695 [Gigaspora margarita]